MNRALELNKIKLFFITFAKRSNEQTKYSTPPNIKLSLLYVTEDPQKNNHETRKRI